MFSNFQGLWRSSFIWKELSLSFIAKAQNLTKGNCSKDLTLQRYALADVLQNRYLFQKSAGLQPGALLQKRPQHRCFPVNFIVIKTSNWYHFRQYFWLHVNFENGFACWENFENQHSEKVTKVSEICKEISVAEFHYSQTIFCGPQWFYFTLFEQKNNEQRAKSKKQRAKSNKQRTKSNKQRVMCYWYFQ